MKLSIIGGGSYGTALAERLCWNAENQVSLLLRDSQLAIAVNEQHANPRYFPGRKLSAGISAGVCLKKMNESDAVFLAVPSNAVETVAASVIPHLRNDCLLINMAKGLAVDGGTLASKLLFPRVAALKGPTFAVDLFNGLPSALTIGSTRYADFECLSKTFRNTGVTLDYAEDVRAVEYLSVLKNVYAIALGIVSGKYGSPNSDFLLFTRALTEMRNYLTFINCDPETVFKYCGVGDFGLTAINDLSRNRTLGLMIGKGFLGDVVHSPIVVEGIRSVKVLARTLNCTRCARTDFLILGSLAKLLEGDLSVEDFLRQVGL